MFRLIVLQGPGFHLFRRPLLFVEDLLLGGFEHGVYLTDDGRGNNHVARYLPQTKRSWNALSAPFQMKLEMVAVCCPELSCSCPFFLDLNLAKVVCFLRGLLLHYALTRGAFTARMLHHPRPVHSRPSPSGNPGFRPSCPVHVPPPLLRLLCNAVGWFGFESEKKKHWACSPNP